MYIYKSLVLFIFASLIGCNSNDKYSKKNNEVKKEINYRDLVISYSNQAQSKLGKNLVNAINSKGTEYALEFCNEEAVELTDNISEELDINIKRVSDKPRNPDNKADNEELEIIAEYKNKLKNNETLTPVIRKHDGKVYGYNRIVTNEMCLQCHGNPLEDIKKPVFEKIADLYPNDKATGYGANEVRGMWVIEMDEK